MALWIGQSRCVIVVGQYTLDVSFCVGCLKEVLLTFVEPKELR